MNNDEETDLRAKLSAMSWNDLRKKAKNHGIKANMKKTLLIDALVQKITANKDASGSSIEILGSFNNSAQSKNRSVGNGGVIKTSRTFKYAPVCTQAQDNTGDLADDEATFPDVSAKKLSFIEFQDEESREDETCITDEKESQLNTSADVTGDNSIQNPPTTNDEDLKLSGALDDGIDEPNELVLKIDADPVSVKPILCSEFSKKEILMNFTEDESSSLSDEDTQLNTTYDVPQNDGENEELGTVLGSAEPMEVDSFVEAKEKKSSNPINVSIFDADEPLVNFEVIEGAIESSGDRINANDSLVLYTSTPLFDHKSLPPAHTFGSVIHNPLSEKLPAVEKPVEAKFEVAGDQLALGSLNKVVKDQLALVASATPTFDAKVIGSVKSTSSHLVPSSAKLTPSSVNFKFGNVTPADIAKVQKPNQIKSILKRSSMSANRTHSVQNTASVRMDVKRRTIQASKGSSNRVFRAASTPGTEGKLRSIESPKMRFIDLNSSGSAGRDKSGKSQDRSLISRDRSSVSRVYTPYSGPFRYKDTSKMRDAELEKYNREKSQKRQEYHDGSKRFLF